MCSLKKLTRCCFLFETLLYNAFSHPTLWPYEFFVLGLYCPTFFLLATTVCPPTFFSAPNPSPLRLLNASTPGSWLSWCSAPPTPSALPGTPPFVFRMQLSSAEPQMVSNTGYTRLEGLLVCGLHLVLANCDVIGRQDQIVNRSAWNRSTVGQHGLSKCNM